jgi:hypothetical protein
MDMEFHINITQESGASMSRKGTIKYADIYEDVKKVLVSVDISTRKLNGLLTDGEPSMIRKNSNVPSITIDIKKKPYRDLIIRHCLIHQENLCAISLTMTNAVTVVTELIRSTTKN